MMYNNYASNNFPSPYMMQQPAYAPRRQEQPIGQGFGFGANNFFGAGSSFLGNQFGTGSGFTNPSSFFNSTQNASQSANIFGNTMNVSFGATGSNNSYGVPSQSGYQGNSGYIDWSRPRPTGLTPYPPGYGGSGKPPMPYGNDALIPSYGGNYCNPYIPAQPMPQPPVVPQGNYCPPSPPPPYCPPPQPPVYADSKLSYGIVAGDPVTKILDPATGKEISGTVNQAGGYHNYVRETGDNRDGKVANVAGGSFAPFLNGQADPNGFAAAQQAANASGFTTAGLAPRGLNITSLVGAINPAGNVANQQYNLQFGNGQNVLIAGGTQVVTDASGKQFRLVAGGDPADDVYNSPDGLFKVETGRRLPGVDEARTVVTYNEAPGVQNVFHAGFRLVNDGNLATNRASAGTADGSYIPNFSYYDAQYTKAAGKVLAG